MVNIVTVLSIREGTARLIMTGTTRKAQANVSSSAEEKEQIMTEDGVREQAVDMAGIPGSVGVRHPHLNTTVHMVHTVESVVAGVSHIATTINDNTLPTRMVVIIVVARPKEDILARGKQTTRA